MKSIKIATLIVLLTLMSVTIFAQKLKPEEIIAKHLDSIGKPETRASLKSLMVIGDAVVTFVTEKNHTAEGRLVMASQGNKSYIGMSLNASDYQQEKITFDGQKSKVGYSYFTRRSMLGDFIQSNNVMIEEGLLGGALSTAWAPLDMSDTKAKLSGGGNPKKMDGKEVYVVDFAPKGSDIDITLYFEKDTFRHVRTEYKRISSAPIGRSPEASSRMTETRLKVSESYSDFRDEGGLVLPHTYKIVYEETGSKGTNEVDWAFTLTTFTPNPNLEANTFNQ